MKILANCSLKLFDYEVAETQCKKALELFRSLEYSCRDDINELLIHLGNLSNRSKKYVMAEEYFKEALPLSLLIEDDVATILPDKLYENYCGLVTCCRELSKEKEADKYLRKAIGVCKTLKAKRPDLYASQLRVLMDSVKKRPSIFSFMSIGKKS